MSQSHALSLIAEGNKTQGLEILKNLAGNGEPDHVIEYNYQVIKLKPKSEGCKTSLNILEKLARSENNIALLKLGVLYKNGWYVSKSEQRALVYFEKAAKLGNAKAMHNLGEMYLTRKQMEVALYYYKQASELGITESNERLVEIMSESSQRSKDPEPRLSFLVKPICFNDFNWNFGTVGHTPNINWVDRGEKTYKSLEILGENGIKQPELAQYLKDLFQNHFKTSDKYKIVKAFSIENPLLLDSFVYKKDNLERRASDSVFHKSYPEEDRLHILNTFNKLASTFTINQSSNCKAIPLVHGLSNPSVAWKICSTGMATLSTLDQGWYGAGMYFTSFADYAIEKYAKPDEQGLKVLIVCWVITQNPYPVVENAFRENSLLGRKLIAPHDSHYVLIAKNGTVQVQNHQADEFCIDQENQVVPRFVVYFKSN